MKIGVTSDTHSCELPEQMMKDFKDVDIIVHAGDFSSSLVHERLAKIKELHGVLGNMDESDLRHVLKKKEIFKAGKYTVGVIHGEGAPDQVLDYVRSEFKKDKVDVVIFGHSHNPTNEKINGVLYFNPGSPTDMIYAPYCSYGIIDLTDNGIKAKIIRVE